jgi:Tfp pilus assembly protein PilP
MQIVRPRLRPDNVQEDNERNTFGGFSLAELAKIRPLARPGTEKELAEQDPTATAQAIDTSRRPITRPRNFATTVAAAIKKQVSTDSAPRATQVAATIAPKIPSSASVAKQATVTNAISLNKVNLIGVYGKPSSRRALVRLANGRYKKVQVGDTVDGGRVAAIGESELRYVKGGRNLVLKLPQG